MITRTALRGIEPRPHTGFMTSDFSNPAKLLSDAALGPMTAQRIIASAKRNVRSLLELERND